MGKPDLVTPKDDQVGLVERHRVPNRWRSYSDKRGKYNPLIGVGPAGFEPTTSCTPSKRGTPHPDPSDAHSLPLHTSRRSGRGAWRDSTGVGRFRECRMRQAERAIPIFP